VAKVIPKSKGLMKLKQELMKSSSEMFISKVPQDAEKSNLPKRMEINPSGGY
jgi:hypothetical protein